MKSSKIIDPGHAGTRTLLRIVGPIVLVAGLGSFLGAIPLVMATGYPAFGFLGFVGVFLLFIGSTMTMFGFAGAVARYHAQEIAPVASDTLNYVAEETRPGVRAMAGALREGLSGEQHVACPACGIENDAQASFCDSCGAALQAETACPACGTHNDPDARFCDACGSPLRQP